MTIYEKNIICIKQNCPYIDSIYSNSGSFSFVVEKAKNGFLTASAEMHDGNNKRVYMHSRYNPSKEAAEFVSGILGEAQNTSEECCDCTVLIFGIGLGHHLKILSEKITKRSRVIAVEPNISFFGNVLQYVDLTDILSDERFYFILGKSVDELRIMLVNYFNVFNAHSMVSSHLPAYRVLFERDYNDFYLAVGAVKQSVDLMRYISYERGSLSIQNLADNLRGFKEYVDFRRFAGKLNNVPGVIVTAGPSLDKNIEKLRALKGRAFIICVYTALAPLLRRGIVPDVVISMDAKQLIRESASAKQERYSIPLIHVATSPGELLKKFTGVKILCLTDMDEYLMEALRKINKIEPGVPGNVIKLGGSVACSALDFAVHCACNPIIFVGLDLAFADDNKTHAEGTSYDYTDKEFMKRLDMLPVPGVDGKPVRSADNMIIYRKWIEKYISLDKSGRIYVDATEGGALIEGTHVETLEAADRKYIGNDHTFPGLNQIIEEQKMFTDNEYEFLLSDIAKTLEMYEDFITELSKRVSMLIRRHEIDADEDSGCREMLNSIDGFIEEKNNELKLFSLLFNYAYILADRNYAGKSRKFYMNSYEFKLNFYKILLELIPSNILTFKASMPINEVKRYLC